ncbi:MAG: hypothetical protein HQK52_22245 [Oligoflexia bacterium]|nr:hypothetical protein [Oligoflexia bacterium]
MLDRNGFFEKLRSIIDQYLEQNGNRNISKLAQSAGISEAALRKAYNKQCVLRPENLLKILKIISSSENIFDITSYGDNYFKPYLSGLIHYDENKRQTCTIIDTQEINDFYKYVIIKRVSHRDEIRREDIRNLFGEMGLKKLDEMILTETIIEKEDILALNITTTAFSLPPHLYSTHVGDLIKTFFKYQNAIDNYSTIRTISNSVDQEAYLQIMTVLANASNEIQKISDSSSGNIPFIFCGMVDQLNFNQSKNGELQ